MTDGTPVPSIERLCRPTATRLRSSLVIPCLPQVLTELAHNALDAGAGKIECWVNLMPGEESIRVEDDGGGIARGELGAVGERYRSSKGTEGWSGHSSYGYRGEALASISALALLEITSRVAEDDTHSKIIRNGQTLYLGTGRTDLGRAHGTTVTVRDLFNSIPVRRASLASAPGTSLAACRQAVESLVLVAPRVRWTLWENRLGRMKRVLHWGGGRNSLEAFRGLYGHSSVERVQSIRVSAGAGERRVDGFISLEGAFNKAHQHLYINGYSVANSELQKTIGRRFAASRFSAISTNLIDDTALTATKKQPSPRRLERYPVYVLNVTLPSEEVDAAYDARKSTIGYKEPGRTRAFVIAVIDDFLNKNGFGVPRGDTASPAPNPSRRGTPGKSSLGATPITEEPDELAPNTARRLFLESYRHDSPAPGPQQMVSSSNSISSTSAIPTPTTEEHRARSPELPQPPTPFSIEELLEQTSRQVIKRTRKFGHPNSDPEDDTPQTSRLTTWLPPVSSDMKFSHESIASAAVLRQVDRKFIPCVLHAEDVPTASKKVLVILDQHAADERVSVEKVLDALSEGFATNNMAVTDLTRLDHEIRVVLTRQEVMILGRPGVREILRRWGIGLGPGAPGEYAQVSVHCVPSLLDRLARKTPTELTRLLRLYLPVLVDHLEEIRVLAASFDNGARDGSHGWASVQRWMPLEMVELANSKACRGALLLECVSALTPGAIMFEDRLDMDQCTRLVTQLSAARNPWICAHGRPTLVPLTLIPEMRPPSRRQIDWAAWKHANQPV